MKRTYKLLLTTAAAALITVSAISASVLLTKPAASAFDSGYVAVDATSDDAMGWLGLEHDGALDIRDGYTETVDADIASERVLQLYGKSVRARYDGSVTDSNSRFGYDIYRIADIDDYFAGHEAEYAAAGYGERKIEKLKEKDMYGKVLIDRADGTVRSFFLPILIDLDGANDDEGVKTAAMDWLSRYVDTAKYNDVAVSSIGSRYEIIARSIAANGLELENMCLAVTANGVVSAITRNPVHYADEAATLGSTVIENARAAADAKLAAVIGENGYTLDGSTVTSAQYSEYDGRPMIMFSYELTAHDADDAEAESYSDLVDIAVFAD